MAETAAKLAGLLTAEGLALKFGAESDYAKRQKAPALNNFLQQIEPSGAPKQLPNKEFHGKLPLQIT